MSERAVHRLKLRGPSQTLLQRGARQLEDALRTASLSEAGGRLLLVRRLDLGRMRVDAAPQALTSSWEALFARESAAPVHALGANAATARVVWFRDALEAHSALAERLASGERAWEWFWPLALRGWRAGSDAASGLRWLAFSLAERPEAAVALPRWTRELVCGGHARCLIDALHPGDGDALSHRCGLGASSRSRIQPESAASVANARKPRQRTGRHVGNAAPGATTVQSIDDRWGWLRAMLSEWPSDIEFARVALSEREADEPRTLQRVERPTAAALHVDGEKHGRQKAEGPALAHPVLQPASRNALSQGEAPAPIRMRRAMSTAAAPMEENASSATTEAGGLLFLLPVLARLGYAKWNAGSRHWERRQIARPVLALALQRVSVPDADPAWLLALHPNNRGQTPINRRLSNKQAKKSSLTPIEGFLAPVGWVEGLGRAAPVLRVERYDDGGLLWDIRTRLLVAAWRGRPTRFIERALASATAPPVSTDGRVPSLSRLVAHAWLTASRLWLQRYAGMTLAQLVLRPADMDATPTHVDLSFEHGLADLRIRRAGLDLDPGWLPWYGRVVAFHYQAHRRG